MRTLAPVAALAALFAFAFTADAQNSRRQRQDPELVIETGGRTGACDDLRFTADGKQLLAVGDDKVVRVWSVADGEIDPKSVRALRWGVLREQRGAIYAMDLSPDGKQVAVCGVGEATPTVALLDITSGDILDLALPPTTPPATSAPSGPPPSPRPASASPSAAATAASGSGTWTRTPSAVSANLPRPERSTRFACCASPMKIISCPWRRTAGCCGGRWAWTSRNS